MNTSYTPFDAGEIVSKHGSAGADASARGDAVLAMIPYTAHSLLATSALPSTRLFPIVVWAVRSGRTMAYHSWLSGVDQLLAALGLTRASIGESPPEIPTLEHLQALGGTRGTRAAYNRAVQERLRSIDVFDAWQRVNTALYWHLRPSLKLAGSDALDDQRFIDTLYRLGVADGRTLLTWALGMVKYDGRDAQINLLRALTTVELRPTATCAQLKVHAMEMHEVWLLLLTSRPEAPAGLSDLYDFLVKSIPPTAPATQPHLVSVRTWLANQVAVYKALRNPEFASYRQAVQAMVEYAQLLGLPAGDSSAAAMVVIDSAGVVAFSSSKGGGGGSLLSLRSGPRPAPEKPPEAPGNKCAFCDSWWCTALLKASGTSGVDCKQFCVCCSDSTFDADSVSKGGTYIKSRRIYHKDNPNITTMKGLRLKMNKDGTVEKTESPGKGGKGGGRGAGGRGRGRGSLNMLTEESQSMQSLSNEITSSSSSADQGAQMKGESFDEWLERQDNLAPSLSMIVPKPDVPSEALIFHEGGLTVIDDDLMPSQHYATKTLRDDMKLASELDDSQKRDSQEQSDIDTAMAKSMQDEEQQLADSKALEQQEQRDLDSAMAQSIHDEDVKLSKEGGSSSALEKSCGHSIEQVLTSTLTCMRNDIGGVELEAHLRELSTLLGTPHSKTSTRSAIQAVLATIIWPECFTRDQDAWEKYKCSISNFYNWKPIIHSIPCLQAVKGILALDQMSAYSTPRSTLAGGSTPSLQFNSMPRTPLRSERVRLGSLFMLGGSSKGALESVKEDDNVELNDGADDDDINAGVDECESDAVDAATVSLDALKRAQAEISRRESEIEQLQAQQSRNNALIMDLQRKVQGLQSPTGANSSGLVTPTSNASSDVRGAVPSPGLNPALQSTESLRTSTPSTVGIDDADKPDRKTPNLAPMPSLFAMGGSRDKWQQKTLTEHLANAMLLNERQLRSADNKKAGILAVVSNTLCSIMVAITSCASKLTSTQWASIFVITQVIRPWAQPHMHAIWTYFLERLRINAVRMLESGLNKCACLLLRAVTRLAEMPKLLAARVTPQIAFAGNGESNLAGANDTNALSAPSSADRDDKPESDCGAGVIPTEITTTESGGAECATAPSISIGTKTSPGMLLMMGSTSAGKRAQPTGLATSSDDRLGVLVEAWTAFQSSRNVDQCRRQLGELAVVLGHVRLTEHVYYNTASVLAMHIWPDEFATLPSALEHFGAGVVRPTNNAGSRLLSRALAQLLDKVGGIDEVHASISRACTGDASSAAMALAELLPASTDSLKGLINSGSASDSAVQLAMGAHLVATPSVTAILGTSGSPDKPVVLRLALPTLGVLQLLTVDNSERAIDDDIQLVLDSLCPRCENLPGYCVCSTQEAKRQCCDDSDVESLCCCSLGTSYDSDRELELFFSQSPSMPLLNAPDSSMSPVSPFSLSLDDQFDMSLVGTEHVIFMMTGAVQGSLTFVKHKGGPRESRRTVLSPTDYKPNTLASDEGCIAALCDNGASRQVSCCKTLDGALLDTFDSNDVGDLTVGSADASLGAKGSYIYVMEWFGCDGSGQLVARRCKHTPNLPLDMVVSEPTEVYTHGSKFPFDSSGRTMVTRAGHEVPLWMATDTGLGYLKVRFVTDPSKIQLALGHAGSVMALGAGEKRSVGMPCPSPLTGVALLRSVHVTYAHASLKKTLQILKAMDTPSGRVTTQDIQEWVRSGCGICESSRMKRRAFSLQNPEDRTPAPVGKKWSWDSLALRIPTAHHGYVALFLAVDSTSKKKFVIGMHGQTAEDYIRAHNALRAYNRPYHGEMYIVKGDSHPSHRSRELGEYFLDRSTSTLKLIGPGQVHEFVGDCENVFMISVPVACGLLMGSPDLGESHFASAFMTAVAAVDYSVITGLGAEDTPVSCNMVYFEKTEWLRSPLYAYGSAAKAFIHERDTKFDLHSRPCVYAGPAHLSNSPIHCSVWDGDRYLDVDVGCINVDDRVVIARTERTHPSHQPFNQTGVYKEIEVNTEQWYDPLSSRHPMDAASDDAGSVCSVLPIYAGDVWVAGCAAPECEFSFGIGSGVARDGDLASFLFVMSGQQHVHFRIDPVIGGYEHRIERAHVSNALIALSAHSRCRGGVVSLPCGPWSYSKFNDDGGPTPIFDIDSPDGKVDEKGEVLSGVAYAMAYVQAGVAIMRALLKHDTDSSPKVVISEHPAAHGRGAVLEYKGGERHSTMHQTTPFLHLVSEFDLQSVLTDLGAHGHDHQKPTEMLCNKRAAPALRRIIGSRAVSDDFVPANGPLRGKDEHGNYKTKGEQEYKPLLCKRLAASFLESLPKGNVSVSSGDVAEGGVENDNAAIGDKANNTSYQSEAESDCNALNTFAIGDRVEVYWTKEFKWYAGVVTDNTRVHNYKVKGRACKSPIFDIDYDDGLSRAHSLHNTEIRHSSAAPCLNVLLQQRVQSGSLNFLSNDVAAKPDDAVILFDIQLDIETGKVLNTSTLFMVDSDNKLIAAAQLNSMNTLNARYWHEPTNEQEFERSPQRGLWQTAKELKWEEYINLQMFEWVTISSVNRLKNKVYNTLWAYKIKLHSDLTFNKLSPRWCLKGGTMDRNKFHSHQETLRVTTFRTILAIKAGYWDAFADFLIDCSNAFQNTRTDGDFEGTSPEMFCYPAPGFEKFDDSGEKMVCKLKVGMQGRIDATSLFNNRLFALLLVKAGVMRALWDRQLMIYHQGVTVKSDLPLSEVLNSIKTETDTDAQQPPVGYALIGWHVDDGTGLACSVGWNTDYKTNRVVQFLRGTTETLFATTCTGWHGNKALGFTLTLRNGTVNMAAPDAVAQLAKDLLSDKVVVAPKQAITKEFFDIEKQPDVNKSDPQFTAVMDRMSLTRHGLGVSIWLSLCYIEIMRGTNELCSAMTAPSAITHKCLCYQTMYLQAYGRGLTYGPCAFGSLEQTAGADVSDPRAGAGYPFLHFFSDANLSSTSVTGGIGMLAHGAVIAISQRQHLKAPCAHTAEVVAASTNLNLLVPVSGVLQELRIRRGVAIAFYLDSMTTVFVAKSDTAIKKSVWLIRRAAVLEDGVTGGEISPIHITETDMAADPFTKFLPRDVWIRHMNFVCNAKS